MSFGGSGGESSNAVSGASNSFGNSGGLNPNTVALIALGLLVVLAITRK